MGNEIGSGENKNGNESGNLKITKEDLLGKESVEYEIFIEEGWDNVVGKKCPVSRLPNGMRALFRRDHHKYLRPGETWSCRVEEERPNFCFVVPLKRTGVSTMSEASGNLQSMDPKVKDMLMGSLEDKMISVRARLVRLREEMEPLEKRREELNKALEEVNRSLGEKNGPYEDLTEEMDTIVRAIEQIQGALPKDVDINTIQDSLSAGPDYWEDKTREAQEKGEEPPRQSFKYDVEE